MIFLLLRTKLEVEEKEEEQRKLEDARVAEVTGFSHSSMKELLPPGRGSAGVAQQCPVSHLRRDSPSEWVFMFRQRNAKVQNFTFFPDLPLPVLLSVLKH